MEKTEYIGYPIFKIKKNSDLWNEILTFFHKSWNTLRDGKFPPVFPGPQPVSIERRHFDLLKISDYVVCEKTDGVRHVLMCYKFGNKNYTLLINRALDVYVIQISVPRLAFNGTILDGELVKTHEGAWNFIVYDTVLVGGEDVRSENLLTRLEHVEKFIKKIIKMKKDIFVIKIKKMYCLSDFNSFKTEKYPNMPYETDGLVFTPVHEAVKIGTHERMFKWKPTEKNTVDFQSKKGQSSWRLYLQEKGKLHFASEIPFSKVNKSFEHFLKEDNIVECKYIEPKTGNSWWCPIGIRTDKYHPNNSRTLSRTMTNLLEDISIDEFSRKFS
jgi:hypothetical protein